MEVKRRGVANKKCEYCDCKYTLFNNLTSLKMHIIKIHRQVCVRCQLCNEIYNKLVPYDTIRRHYTKYHPNDPLVKQCLKIHRSNPGNVVWTEEQQVELRILFTECKNNKSEQDVIECIMERLDIQRPKESIIEKILDLGLVKDTRELRIETKFSSNDTNVRDFYNDRNKCSNRNEDDPKLHCLVQSEVLLNAKIILDLGMNEALDWIKLSLNEVLDGIFDDEEGVPILPLDNYSINAMKNENFLNFLKSIGIKPPAKSQRVHWRIPRSWKANDIRERINVIDVAINTPSNTVYNESTIGADSQIDKDFNDNHKSRNNTNSSFQSSNNSTTKNENYKSSNVSAPSETLKSEPVSSNRNISVDAKKKKRVNVEESRNVAKKHQIKKKIRGIENDVDNTNEEIKMQKKKSRKIVNDNDDNTDEDIKIKKKKNRILIDN